MVRTFAILLWLTLSSSLIPAAGDDYLRRAHAHNDYEHPKPLINALGHGFGSVEADVHLVEGKLLVGHDPEDLSPERTLERLYLEPLKTRVKEHRNGVYGKGQGILLLIDVKTEAESTYAALKEVLRNHSGMLTRFDPEGIRTNAVTVILSGNRPSQTLRGEDQRLVAYDGRLSDLGRELPNGLVPLISDNWQKHFTWRGEGNFPEAERTRLREIVKRVHAEGKMIRFWATPDTEAAWRELDEAGVDLINTDDLAGLASYLRSR